MARIAAIGERLRIVGLASAGVQLRAAERPDAVRAAWHGLPPDVQLVILTPVAAAALDPAALDAAGPLIVVMPP